MSFESDLAKFLGRPSVQKKITAVAVKNIRAGGVGAASSQAAAEKWAQKARAEIIAFLPLSLQNSRTHKIVENDLVIEYDGITDDGKFRFNMRWNPDAVQRDSLYSPLGVEGIDDIVGLFYSGSQPSRHSVWGQWHGRRVYLRKGWHRTPDHFLDVAIYKFNIQYAKDGVTLKMLPNPYYK